MNRHVTWFDYGDISIQQNALSQSIYPVTIWLTGLSGSGKSTIAKSLVNLPDLINVQKIILDGDNIRHGLCSDLGFTRENRRENLRRISEVAKLFNSIGILAICPIISPYAEDRSLAKSIIGDNNFNEIYCECSLDTCQNRDPKNLYEMAKSGLIKNFTAISSRYEPPENPKLTLDTEHTSPEDNAYYIFRNCIR